MQHQKEQIRKTLNEVKAFLNKESGHRLSEADTKANFIEPVILALGWSGIGVVTREYYVKNSQEFIDYVMSGSSGPLLAVEAKALTSDLSEKSAAQLIQYCSVEGIEWAALTNGRELQFFNTFLKPDLAAKRILRLDLLAFNNDAEFDDLLDKLWQLSRESMTTPTGVRTWLNQRRMDAALRAILLNAGSTTIKQLRRALADAEIRVTPQDLTQWFLKHLGAPITTIVPRKSGTDNVVTLHPAPESSAVDRASEPEVIDIPSDGNPDATSLARALRAVVDDQWPDTIWRDTSYYTAAATDGQTFLACFGRRAGLVAALTLPESVSDPRLSPNSGEIKWKRMTKILRIRQIGDIDESLIAVVGIARAHALESQHTLTHIGVRVRDLIAAGLLAPGTPLILKAGRRDVATASVGENGEIIHNGTAYASPSDRAFARMLAPDRISLNGWTHWAAATPSGHRTLADLRMQYLELNSPTAERYDAGT